MAMAEFKNALRNNPALSQKDPTLIAKQFQLNDQEKTWVQYLNKQCHGLKGKELENTITKCGGNS